MALRDRLRTAASAALDATVGASPTTAPVAAPPTPPTPVEEESWREAQTRLDSLLSTATGMGVAAQDKGATITVDTARAALTDQQLTTLTKYNGYIVDYFDKLEDVATGYGWALNIDQTRSEALREDEIRLDLHARVGAAFRSGQEHGGALILPVVDDGATDLREPLDPSRVTKVHALHVFTFDEFSPVEFETSLLEPGFRLPRLWQINPKNAGWAATRGAQDAGPYNASASGASLVVHTSRVLYFRGKQTNPTDRAAKGGRDASVIQHLWDALKALGGVDAGAATMAQEMNFDVIQIAGLSRMEASNAWASILTRFKEGHRFAGEGRPTAPGEALLRLPYPRTRWRREGRAREGATCFQPHRHVDTQADVGHGPPRRGARHHVPRQRRPVPGRDSRGPLRQGHAAHWPG